MGKSGRHAALRARSGPRIRGFEILETLGSGAMGVVYKAQMEGRRGLVALKVIAPRFSRDPIFAKRLLREARAASVLKHENIVQGIDVGESEGLHYFAMEFVEGRSLSAVLKEKGPLSEPEALALAGQIAGALRVAARAGILHRDIKPSNILVTPEGKAKLADLGLVKDARCDEDLPLDGRPLASLEGMDPASSLAFLAAEGHTLTRTGTAMGTPYYMSPEQIRGEKTIDARADIYSLGATLYHAVAGRPPYDGRSVAEVFQRAVEGRWTPLRTLRSDLSEAFEMLVRRMTARDAASRFAGPEALLQAIERVRRGEMPDAPEASIPAARPAPSAPHPPASRRKAPPRTSPAPAPRSGRRGPLVIAAAAALVVAAGGYLVLGGNRGAPERAPLPTLPPIAQAPIPPLPDLPKAIVPATPPAPAPVPAPIEAPEPAPTPVVEPAPAPPSPPSPPVVEQPPAPPEGDPADPPQIDPPAPAPDPGFAAALKRLSPLPEGLEDMERVLADIGPLALLPGAPEEVRNGIEALKLRIEREKSLPVAADPPKPDPPPAPAPITPAPAPGPEPQPPKPEPIVEPKPKPPKVEDPRMAELRQVLEHLPPVRDEDAFEEAIERVHVLMDGLRQAGARFPKDIKAGLDRMNKRVDEFNNRGVVIDEEPVEPRPFRPRPGGGPAALEAMYREREAFLARWGPEYQDALRHQNTKEGKRRVQALLQQQHDFIEESNRAIEEAQRGGGSSRVRRGWVEAEGDE